MNNYHEIADVATGCRKWTTTGRVC